LLPTTDSTACAVEFVVVIVCCWLDFGLILASKQVCKVATQRSFWDNPFLWASALPYIISHGKKFYFFWLLLQLFFIGKALMVYRKRYAVNAFFYSP